MRRWEISEKQISVSYFDYVTLLGYALDVATHQDQRDLVLRISERVRRLNDSTVTATCSHGSPTFCEGRCNPDPSPERCRSLNPKEHTIRCNGIKGHPDRMFKLLGSTLSGSTPSYYNHGNRELRRYWD